MGQLDHVRENLRRAYAAGRESVRAARAEARAADAEAEQLDAAARAPLDPAQRAPLDPAQRGQPDPAQRGQPDPAQLAQLDPDHRAPLEPRAPERAAPSSPPIVVASTSVTRRDDLDVPRGLRIAAAWAWRILLLVLAGAAVLWVIARLQLVIVPLIIALLLTALLSPVVSWLWRRRVPRSLATTVVVIGGIAAVAGTLTLVINQFVTGFPELSENAAAGIQKIQDWVKSELNVSQTQLNAFFDGVRDWLTKNRTTLAGGALSATSTLFHVLAGLFLVLFATFFFLRDGRRIARFLVGLLPVRTREPIASALDVSWTTLVSYVRATVLVAFIDAVGIGLALAILRVPFALPLAALVFLGAFIPIVGATISGIVAVLVALVTRGPFVALLVLTAVIAVQQLEGHVLQPLIMGRAVAIHPLAVIIAIAGGVVLAGIVGALVAVPIVAVLNTGIRHLAAIRRAEETGVPPPGPPAPTGPPQPGAEDASLSPLPPGA